MKESVLKSLMRLFAIVSQLHEADEVKQSVRVLEKYLTLVVRKDKVRQYVIMYEFYHNSLREREAKTGEKQLSLFSVKAVIICEQVNQYLDKKQKIFILTHLLEVLSVNSLNKTDDVDFIKTIARAFRIEESLFYDCKHFVFGELDLIKQKSHVLIVDNGAVKVDFKHIYKDFLNGQIIFFYVEGNDICLFRQIGKDDVLYYNDRRIELNRTYIFYEGGNIKSPLIEALFYNEVLKQYLHDDKPERVYFVADKVSFQFPNSDFGIEPFTLSEESGQLIGIMGNSGVGKSTLLNLLNGNLRPKTGKVMINGYDISEDKEKVRGLIGYIPQDDMLIEELTVFQNLYYSAKLCFRGFSKDKLDELVTKILKDLGLYEAKDLTVGNPLNKFISGGQRKRLNIALEIIREPNILFVDEPTSGLSSTDSEIVMDLLKKQSLKGKLVIVNIHQPSSDIFKKIDKLLLLDKGGRLIYQGNPLGSLTHLKSYQQLLNADEGECSNCGNINPEQALQIIESKKVDEYGNYTSERLVKPEKWYENYSKELEKELNAASYLKVDLPKTKFRPLSPLKQFVVFTIRNILAKASDRQYVVINLFEAPILAFVLGWFTKYNAGTSEDPSAYVFSLNSNIPIYIFMSVVVAVFLGLMVSAEEIIKDRTILKREAFLNLNRNSYFNSKVFYLIIVLAIQMFLFVFISNSILEIREMNFHYWLILWCIAMVAGILGLNLSATMKSVVSIYILIPLLIVPQLLLGGAMIPYNKLHSKLASPVFVPIAGDIMPSRWAYEALSVYQFTHNKYEREFFEYDQKVSEASFMQNYFIPELEKLFKETKKLISNNSQKYLLRQKFQILKKNVQILKESLPFSVLTFNEQDLDNINISQSQEIGTLIFKAKEYYNQLLDKAIEAKDNKVFELEDEFNGSNQIVELKRNYTNEKLSEVVKNRIEPDKFVIFRDEIVQITDPIYKISKSKFGRSQFFAAKKKLFGFAVETYWFNTFVLLLFFIALYIMLIFELWSKLSKELSQQRLSWLFFNMLGKLKNIITPRLK